MKRPITELLTASQTGLTAVFSALVTRAFSKRVARVYPRLGFPTTAEKNGCSSAISHRFLKNFVCMYSYNLCAGTDVEIFALYLHLRDCHRVALPTSRTATTGAPSRIKFPPFV